MIKILVTGKNSYVGTSFVKWIQNFPDKYSIHTISLRDKSWVEMDFSLYDVVLHVAGIAHIKETSENNNIYYKVNRDLTFEVAKKCKVEGVRHFIFLSSMSVYGIENGVIDINTPLNPKTNYGKSKLEAEKLILNLENTSFKIAILRPPMIYGKGCKGNYLRLAKIALKAPVFPKIDNNRSMIYIDNLSNYIKFIIDNYSSGIFCPQNSEYVNTSKMVELIAKTHGKKIWITKLLNPIISVMMWNKTINKAFGNLIYDKSLSNSVILEQIPLEESIKFTET